MSITSNDYKTMLSQAPFGESLFTTKLGGKIND